MRADTQPAPWRDVFRVRPRALPRAARAARVWRALAAPFAVALAARLALVLALDAGPAWDGVIYARAAEQLAAGEGYTLRILDPASAAVPTAFYPVGYPAALWLVRELGGGLGADRILHALCSAMLVPLSYLFARRSAGPRAARLAAWLTACWPGAILFSATWLAEPLFALACGIALLPVLYARRAHATRALFWTGILLGLTAFVRPTALLVAGLTGAGVGFARHRSKGAGRAWLSASFGAAVALGSAALPLAPWVARNHAQLGAPVWVSTNGGVNLLIGALHDGGYERLPEPQPCWAQGLSEVQRDRCFTRQALAEIRERPDAWLGRVLLKVAHTFGHESAVAQALIQGAGLPASSPAALWLLGVCRVGWLVLAPFMAVGGCVLAARALRRRPSRVAIVTLAPIVAVAILHGVFLSGDRYHGALIPMLGALAGVGALALGRVIRASADQAP